jgi:hypothetical protein
MIKIKIFCLVSLLPVMAICLGSCSQIADADKGSALNSIPNSELKRFMITIAPINKNSLLIDRVFLSNSKKSGSKTRIITNNHEYVLAEICEGDKAQFPTPNMSVSRNDSKSINSITLKQELSLNSISDKKKNCNATARSLIDWAKYIGQYSADQTTQKKMITFLQVPWAAKDIDAETMQILRYEMDKAAASNKIERIVIFGVNPDATAKVAMAFQAFNQGQDKRLRFSTDIPQLIENLKEVHSQFIK